MAIAWKRLALGTSRSGACLKGPMASRTPAGPRIRIPANTPCPCGHGRLLEQCCWKQDRILPAGVGNIAPVGPHSREGCYAAELRGCSGPLSLEHYVSKATLHVLAGASDTVRIDGIAPNKPVGINSFGANILCKTHNEALSRLDERGTGFFEALRHHSSFSELANPPFLAAFNGYDVERWLLKILIGLAYRVLPNTKKSWEPPLWWLRVLYGKKDLPRGRGLVLSSRIGETLSDDGRLGVRPLYDAKSGAPAGISVVIAGLEFTLVLSAIVSTSASIYRPGSLQFTSALDGRNTIVALGWHHPHPWDTVHVDWSRNTALKVSS